MLIAWIVVTLAAISCGYLFEEVQQERIFSFNRHRAKKREAAAYLAFVIGLASLWFAIPHDWSQLKLGQAVLGLMQLGGIFMAGGGAAIIRQHRDDPARSYAIMGGVFGVVGLFLVFTSPLAFNLPTFWR